MKFSVQAFDEGSLVVQVPSSLVASYVFDEGGFAEIAAYMVSPGGRGVEPRTTHVVSTSGQVFPYRVINVSVGARNA